jgi:hypothetical protein
MALRGCTPSATTPFETTAYGLIRDGATLEALKAGRLVSMASVRLLTTPKPELNSPTYGFGFVIDEGGRVVGHSGGFTGINSQLDIYVGEPYTFAVMSNYGGAAQRVAQKVRTLVLAGRRADRTQKA